MEDKEIENNLYTISETERAGPEHIDEYHAFYESEREKAGLESLLAKIDQGDPHYKDTPEYKHYMRERSRLLLLSQGSKIMTLASEYNNQNPTADCFVHVARTPDGKAVGFAITTFYKGEEGQPTVHEEFLGVSRSITDNLIAQRLLEARHSELIERGIENYTVSTSPKIAKLVKRYGFDIQNIEGDSASSPGKKYKIILRS